MSYGKISKKQSEILEYIKNEILNRGFPPSVREICEAVNLKSTSSVHSHLETLEKNGYIRRDPTKPRAIEIVDDNFNLVRRETVNVPIIGKVAAGQPLLAVENVEGYFPIPSEYMPNNKTFMLVVQGDSMVNAGIFNGDYVVVEQQPTAENGQKVVALVDDSATVKTFYKEDGYIRLQPENDAMEPIIVEPDQTFQVLGKVIGVFRFMRWRLLYHKRPQRALKSHETFKSFLRSLFSHFCYLFFIKAFPLYQNAVSPDTLQVIEQTVFLIKDMDDHISVI